MTSQRNRGYPRNSGYDRIPRDFYCEPRWVVHLLLDAEPFDGEVYDPCCGTGTIPSVCLSRGIPARGSDIADRGFGAVRDLFTVTETVDNIVSNPPFKISEACVRHMLKLARQKVALILPMTFWESRERNAFFREHPPRIWYPCSDRPSMPPGTMDGPRDEYGAVIQPNHSGGTMLYGWLVWQIGYRGPTEVGLLNLLPRRDRDARQKRLDV